MKTERRAEDNIYVLVDYKRMKRTPSQKDVNMFKKNVLEDGLGYVQNCSPDNYVDPNKTGAVRVLQRKFGIPKLNVPIHLLSSINQKEDYNIGLVIHISGHSSFSDRDIKGHYKWITHFLEANNISYIGLNPPLDNRGTQRVTVKSNGIEKTLEAER